MCIAQDARGLRFVELCGMMMLGDDKSNDAVVDVIEDLAHALWFDDDDIYLDTLSAEGARIFDRFYPPAVSA
jgi:hypothetical protein